MQFNNNALAFHLAILSLKYLFNIASKRKEEKSVHFKLVAKLMLTINISTWFSVSELNMKDKKVAIDASCACLKNGH